MNFQNFEMISELLIKRYKSTIIELLLLVSSQIKVNSQIRSHEKFFPVSIIFKIKLIRLPNFRNFRGPVPALKEIAKVQPAEGKTGKNGNGNDDSQQKQANADDLLGGDDIQQ